MTTQTLTVDLSYQDLYILSKIASQHSITPNQALSKCILQSGYLHQVFKDGDQLFVGKLNGDNLNKDSEIYQVKFNV